MSVAPYPFKTQEITEKEVINWFQELRQCSNANETIRGKFDGSVGSPSVTGGKNVSSVTKNSTGDYTINTNITFKNTESMCLFGTANQTDGSTTGTDVGILVPITFTTSTIRFMVVNSSGTKVDAEVISFAVSGDIE